MYILCFALVLLTPVCLLVLGLLWQIRPPRFGVSFAYRTSLSSRSQDCWTFAHRHISKLWVRIGLLTGILAAVLMIVLKDNYRGYMLWIIGAEMVFLCLSAILVDALLKNAFDEDGKPI